MKHNFKPFDRVLVRDADDIPWKCQFYSHPYEDFHATLDGVHWQCIPFAGNEALLGTTDGPEPEFKKGDAVLVWDDGDVGKYIRVYSHYDSELRLHMAFTHLLRDRQTTGADGWDHAEKFVPATVETQDES